MPAIETTWIGFAIAAAWVFLTKAGDYLSQRSKQEARAEEARDQRRADTIESLREEKRDLYNQIIECREDNARLQAQIDAC